jgi:hypothetical protein
VHHPPPFCCLPAEPEETGDAAAPAALWLGAFGTLLLCSHPKPHLNEVTWRRGGHRSMQKELTAAAGSGSAPDPPQGPAGMGQECEKERGGSPLLPPRACKEWRRGGTAMS